MTEMSQLELIEFNDLLGDDDEVHIYCAMCHPNVPPRSLMIALCGTVFRIQGVLVKDGGLDDVKCSGCLEVKRCPKCGSRMT